MGRKKKVVVPATDAAMKYIMDAIHRYPEIREACVSTESQRPLLLQRVNINPLAFRPEAEPSEELFVQPELSGRDGALIDSYLADREKLYLLEHGILGLDEELKEFAEAVFLGGLTRAEVEQSYCLSQSTITRKRNEVIRQLAVEVDSYMDWKAEMLFG